MTDSGEVVWRIEVFREDDGRFAAEFRSGDGMVGGMGEYSVTPVGALANLCAMLIQIAEDEAVERATAARDARSSSDADKSTQ